MTDRLNVLFLYSDEHNYRFHSHLDEDDGGEPASTPTLDRLATRGTRFEQAYCPVPLCLPSRMSTLTGLEQARCSAWHNESVLFPEYETFPRILSAAGYETCLVGKMHLTGTQQFAGFDHRPYGDLTGKTGHQVDPIAELGADRYEAGTVSYSQQHASPARAKIASAGITEIPESQLQERNVVDESVAFLREHAAENPNQPWFLCASFSRPHYPLTAPSRHFRRYWPDGVTEPAIQPEGDASEHPYSVNLRKRHELDKIDREEMLRARAAYFACVDFLDEVIGDLLRTLEGDGLLDDTIVVYASDHGELAGEHGLWWKHTWQESAIRVPWSVQLPEHRTGDLEGATIATPVSLLDLYPTLCGLVDIEVPDGLDGVNLSSVVAEGHEPDRGPVVCDHLAPRYGPGAEFRVVVDGQYKYVRFRDKPELFFDLADDPHEQLNLIGQAEGETANALDAMREFVNDSIDFEDLEARREADDARAEEFRLGIPRGTAGNSYKLPDGRLIDGDALLYEPHVLAERPDRVFTDWPDEADDRD